MITYVRILNGQINAYRQEPFVSKVGYTYVSTTIEMDRFCYYEIATNLIKRKTDEEIAEILENERLSSLNTEKTRILALVTDNINLIQDGDWVLIEAYRNYDLELTALIETSTEENPPVFDDIEISVLITVILFKTDSFDPEQLQEKTIEELTNILTAL